MLALQNEQTYGRKKFAQKQRKGGNLFSETEGK